MCSDLSSLRSDVLESSARSYRKSQVLLYARARTQRMALLAWQGAASPGLGIFGRFQTLVRGESGGWA